MNATTARTRRFPLRGRLAAVVVAAVIVVGAMGPAGVAAAADDEPAIAFPDELRFHGVLEGIPGPGKAQRTQVLAVDAQRRRLYATYGDTATGIGHTATLMLNTYDLASDGVPPLLQSRPVTGASGIFGGQPYSLVFDPGRQHVLVSESTNTGAQITRIDLVTAKSLEPFNVTAELPGFSAVGMTYAPEEDRLYLLGEQTGTAAVGSLAGIAGAYRGTTLVVALDAATGKRIWVRPVPECQQPLVTFGIGSLIARSELREALYFFCQPGTDSFGVVGARYPGQSALLRLNIDPTADQAAAAQLSTDVFPVSGMYQGAIDTGIGAFDPGTDRMVVQSRARRTPGAWVFDGRLDAWVGFITAPDDRNRFIAVNPRTGRHYMAGQDETSSAINAYLNIADARLSPVPQGQTLQLRDGTGIGGGGASRIALDPRSQRLFPTNVGVHNQIAVIEDTTPLQSVGEELDFDALTSDVAIGPNTLVQYSAGSAGFGANLRVTGGASGGYGGVPGLAGLVFPNASMPPCPSLGVDDVSCISGGDRQYTIGAVPSVDLRGSGASARATAFEVDANTNGERDGLRRAVRDRTDGEDDGPSSALNPAFGSVDCLDGGGNRQSNDTPEHPLGAAQVVCDLEKNTVTAVSEFGDLAGQPLGISSSSFDTRTWRDAKTGSTTESVAAARGVRIGEQSGAHVMIGAVRTVARTAAGGRPGTTLARWERTLSGITVVDSSGNEVLSAPGCGTLIEAAGGKKPTVTETGDCQELITQVNAALKGRAELRLPTPQVEATPKGAFAAINKTQRDFLQASTMQNDERRAVPALEAIVINDGESKSRLVVQLAGVEANSIFTISDFGMPEPWDPPGDPGPGKTGTTGGEAAGGSRTTTTDPGGATATAGTGAFETGGDVAPALSDDTSSASAVDGPLAAAPLGDVPIVDVGTTVPARLAAGLRWLARTPTEALLVGAMWLLFAGALMTTLRRCLLIRQLQQPTET